MSVCAVSVCAVSLCAVQDPILGMLHSAITVPVNLNLTIESPRLVIPIETSVGQAAIHSYEAFHASLGRIVVKSESPVKLHINVRTHIPPHYHTAATHWHTASHYTAATHWHTASHYTAATHWHTASYHTASRCFTLLHTACYADYSRAQRHQSRHS